MGRGRRTGLALLLILCGCRARPGESSANGVDVSVESRDGVRIPRFRGLVPLSRELAAHASCCEDWEHAVWRIDGFEIPRLELVDESRDIAVVERLGEPGVSSSVAEAIYSKREAFGPGALDSLSLSDGNVVSRYAGGFGGGLSFVGVGGETVVLATELGYRSLLRAGPEQFFVVVGPQERRFRVQCWRREAGVWSSRDVVSDLRSPVLGPSAAAGRAVVVDESASFSEIGCDGRVRHLFDADWESVFLTSDRDWSGTKHPCLLPPGLPQSVRLYLDGTLAMTSMHHVVLLPVESDGGRGEYWFGRDSQCNEPRLVGSFLSVESD